MNGRRGMGYCIRVSAAIRSLLTPRWVPGADGTGSPSFDRPQQWLKLNLGRRRLHFKHPALHLSWALDSNRFRLWTQAKSGVAQGAILKPSMRSFKEDVKSVLPEVFVMRQYFADP